MRQSLEHIIKVPAGGEKGTRGERVEGWGVLGWGVVAEKSANPRRCVSNRPDSNVATALNCRVFAIS